jgi:hypothetical protein
VLSVEIFKHEIIKINKILSQNAAITSDELDVYYEALRECDNEVFQKAVFNLISSWQNANFKITPANILKEIENIKFCGMNEEEFVSVAKTYKALGKAPEDARLKYLIDNVDEKVLAEGKVKFLNDRTSVEQLALINCAM